MATMEEYYRQLMLQQQSNSAQSPGLYNARGLAPDGGNFGPGANYADSPANPGYSSTHVGGNSSGNGFLIDLYLQQQAMQQAQQAQQAQQQQQQQQQQAPVQQTISDPAPMTPMQTLDPSNAANYDRMARPANTPNTTIPRREPSNTGQTAPMPVRPGLPLNTPPLPNNPPRPDLGPGGYDGQGSSTPGTDTNTPTAPVTDADGDGADDDILNSEDPFNAQAKDSLGVYGPIESLYLSAMKDWHQNMGIGDGGYPGDLQYYGNQGDEYADRAQMATWAMNDLGTWGQERGKELAQWITDTGVGKTQQTNLANRITAQFEDPARMQNVSAGTLGNAPQLRQDQRRGLDMGVVADIANNPYLSGQIDAVNRDVARSLTEAGLPQSAMQAMGAGQSGSTRRGVMDALLTRGAQDRMGDISAQMRSNAYNQGIGVAADQSARNQANMLSRDSANQQASLANQQMQFGANLNAALANQRAGLDFGNQQLAAAGLAEKIGQSGIGDMLSGNNLNINNWQAGLQTGLLDQALRQQEINADMNRWNFNQLAPYSTMEMYKGALGLPGNTPWTSVQSGAGAGITSSNSNTLGQIAMGMGSNLIGGSNIFGM